MYEPRPCHGQASTSLSDASAMQHGQSRIHASASAIQLVRRRASGVRSELAWQGMSGARGGAAKSFSPAVLPSDRRALLRVAEEDKEVRSTEAHRSSHSRISPIEADMAVFCRVPAGIAAGELAWPSSVLCLVTRCTDPSTSAMMVELRRSFAGLPPATLPACFMNGRLETPAGGGGGGGM